MADWLSSASAWPSHQKSFWNQTLDVAREEGWYFCAGRKSHVFGRLACKPSPQSLDPSDVCTEVIFKTGGSNPEKVAKQMSRSLRSCPHRVASSPSTDDALANSHVRAATVLLDGAERLIAADERSAQAAENLALAERHTEQADELVERAIAAENQAAEVERAGRAFMARTGVPDLNAPAAIDQADGRLERADSVATDALAEKIAGAKTRSAALKQRLLQL